MDVDRNAWRSKLVKNHDENKTYILVKLSESFSNAIQEHSTPTIKFQGSRGAIKFPSGKNYDFSLEHQDRDVECIRQTENRWESVGKVACCLHVKGKDDVYQRTRTKMAAAEKEKRKYCTKLLGSPEHDPSTPPTRWSDASIAAAFCARVTGNNTKASSKYSRTTEARSSSSLLSSSSSSSSSSSAPASTSTTSTTTANNNIINNNNNTIVTNNNTSVNISNTNNDSTNNNLNDSTSNNINLSKYPDITDVEQLKRYKADFDKDYLEYQHLHGYLQGIEERFRNLRDTLKQSVEGSSEWESAKEQIFNEYDIIKGDSNFHKARSKYKQLYDKLAHLKEKIFQFKRNNGDKYDSGRKKRKR